MHLDTSFLIDLQRERTRHETGKCHRFLEKFSDEPMRISAPVIIEYLEGFSDAELSSNIGFLEVFDRIDIHIRTAIQASRIRRNLRKQGNLLPDADILIAASAMEQSEPLVTDNESHFSRIDGLKLVSYQE